MLLLIQQLDYLKRQLFGRKSEGWDHPYSFTPDTSGELGKPGRSGDTDAPEDDTQAATATSKEPTHRREIRKDRPPENVPVITEEILPAVVEADSDSWRPAGSEEIWQPEKKPGYFYLCVIKRLKFVRRDEPFSPPVIEPAMPSLIHGGFWGSGLLAELLTNTYLDHLPFYRQRVLYLQRHSVDLSESTISAAIDKVVDQLGFLLSRIKDDMLAGGLVRAYETSSCFLDRIHFGGSSREIVIRLVDSISKITKLFGFSKIVRCSCEASPNDDFTMQQFEMESRELLSQLNQKSTDFYDAGKYVEGHAIVLFTARRSSIGSQSNCCQRGAIHRFATVMVRGFFKFFQEPDNSIPVQ